MQLKPRNPRQPFLHARVLADLFAAAAVLFLSVTLGYLFSSWAGTRTAEREAIRGTIAASSFLAWLFGHVALAWAMRTDRISLWRQGWLSNRTLLLWSMGIAFFLLLIASVPVLRVTFLRQSLELAQWSVIVLLTCVMVTLFRLTRKIWMGEEDGSVATHG